MADKNVIEQLRLDYPGVIIDFDEERDLLLMDDCKISLLLDKEALERVHVHSHSGRNYYQAITQLIYSNYKISPRKDSYADSLITYKEDYDQFRLQNLAKDYGIGFLEDGDEVIALKINGDFEEPPMIEEDEGLQDKLRIEQRRKEEGLDEDFGVLLDVNEDEHRED